MLQPISCIAFVTSHSSKAGQAKGRSEERRVGKECRSRCDWSSDVCSSDLTYCMKLGVTWATVLNSIYPPHTCHPQLHAVCVQHVHDIFPSNQHPICCSPSPALPLSHPTPQRLDRPRGDRKSVV